MNSYVIYFAQEIKDGIYNDQKEEINTLQSYLPQLNDNELKLVKTLRVLW